MFVALLPAGAGASSSPSPITKHCEFFLCSSRGKKKKRRHFK